MSEIGVDYELVRTLREQVADEMTRAKQQREIRGFAELSPSDEPQLAMSLITTAVQRHLGGILAAGGELPQCRVVKPGRIQPVMATLNSPTIQRRPPLVSSTLAFYGGGR